MDKNLLAAVALSVGVYALWFGVIEKKYAAPVIPVAADRAIGRGSAASEGSKEAAPAKTGQAPASAPAAAAATGELAAEERAALEAQAAPLGAKAAELKIHPRGAAIVSARYLGPLGAVELVKDPRPGFLATWPELTFKREPGPGVVYTAARADGLRIVKEFLPEGEQTLPRVRVRLINPTKKPLESGEWTLSVGPGLNTVKSETEENASLWRALARRADAKTSLWGGGSVETLKPGEHPGPYRWVGIDNRYFLAAVLPGPEGFGAVKTAMPPRVDLGAKSVTVPPQGEQSWEVPYYLGAKGHTYLERYKADLELSVDFGFFAQFGRFILRALERLHRWTGNWGWAIVILTVILQVLLFPLTYKSLKAAAAMKKLQPEIAKLQQKYAKDPSRLNAEMMELYKKSGANPLGGCLPMLMQMPIFIALFNALRNAWELHGAPWAFWIHDLSSKDPYYVLPIVMGALMVAQNKMNPAAGADPTQAKMMTWMPVIFTFMFLKFPAGLVLYWLTNSVCSTVQQLALKKRLEA